VISFDNAAVKLKVQVEKNDDVAIARCGVPEF
jgi:hypothetical protein